MESKRIPINANGGEKEAPQFRVVDRRHSFETDGAGEAPVEAGPRYPSYVEELKGRMEEMERRFAEKTAQVDEEISRARARLQADYQRELEISRQKILLPFLEVLDNLERALKSAAETGGDRDRFLEGVEMTAGLFRAKLSAHSVDPIEVLDQPFDPNVSQALGVVPVGDRDRDGIVCDEVLRGYRMGDQLLRPALVRVAQYREEETSAASSSATGSEE